MPQERAVIALIESVTCKKILGVKELEDTPLERGDIVMRGEGIGGERIPEFGGRRKKTNIISGSSRVVNFHAILVTGNCLPSIAWSW